ncbi:sensor histidine kinase [Alicyclobacillus tolerans]|uniref:histidine kinase n=1 Tax=Alicyclobacillus tolerans TaxID=90970 RepID=A0A1M6VZ25_9BACL|nr:ATP-binding protein [Alicyclobacillus montanus]SHK86751.1 Signal transduction histidine kinase [Alicyclobacillus montanus]
MSLRSRLLWLTILWFALVMLVFTITFSVFVRQSNFSDYERELTLEVNNVWHAAELNPSDTLMNNNWEDYALFTRSAIAFFNSQGQITSLDETNDFPDNVWNQVESKLSQALLASRLSLKKSIVRLPDITYVENGQLKSMMALARPIVYPTQEVGSVVVVGPTEQIYSKVSSVMHTLFWIDAVSLLIFAAGLYALLQRGLRSLVQLIDGIRTVEWLRSNRVPVPEGPQEIVSVATSINHLLDKVERGVEEQRRFIADASHELRTPLAIVAGHANILRRWGHTNESVWEPAVHHIVTEVDRLQNLVDRLLLLSRLENHQEPVESMMNTEDITSLLQQMADDARLLRPDLRVFEQIHLQAGLAIRMDRNDLRQILVILVDNAMRHTKSGGQIVLAANREASRLRVSVQDSGEGIPADDLPHVFERFYRAKEGRDRNSGGAGLGLSIARQLVELYQGQIYINSRLGEGTTVHLLFPLLLEKGTSQSNKFRLKSGNLSNSPMEE